MSAYGAIPSPSNRGPPPSATIWPIQAARNVNPTVTHTNASSKWLTIHHLTLDSAQLLPGLIDYLNATFAQEVECGMTYPQEGEIGRAAFEGYFFAGDVFVGIPIIADEIGWKRQGGVRLIDLGVEVARNGRAWEDCVGGFYYVSCSSTYEP